MGRGVPMLQGKGMLRGVMLGALLVVLLFQPAHGDVVDDAYRLCSAFQQTGMVSDCQVRGGKQAVDVTMPMRATEAIKACPQMARLAAQAGAHFEGEWQLRIFSPQSVRPMATCRLALP